MDAWNRLVRSWRGLPRILQVLVAAQAVAWIVLVPLPAGTADTLLSVLGFSPSLFVRGHVWQVVTYPLVHAPRDFFGMLFDIALLWVLGSLFARRWRHTHFLFFLLACAATGALTGGLAAQALPETFAPVLTGMDAPVLGLLMAFHLVFGDQQVRLIGLAQPITARWILYVVVGMDVLFFLTGSNPDLGAQAGGLLAGWLMVTGRWRPRKLKAWLAARSLSARWERKRRKFHVVGGDRRGPLH